MQIAKPIHLRWKLLFQHGVIVIVTTKGPTKKNDQLVRQGRSAAKVTLCLSAGARTTSDVVDPIEFGFVEGIDSACGIAGDAQQSVAFPAPSPRWGFDARHRVFWPLSGAGARAPKRLGVAASTGLSPSGP